MAMGARRIRPGSLQAEALGQGFSEQTRISEKEFFEIEDKEVQKYAFYNHLVKTSHAKIWKVDDENKVGYYVADTSIRINLQGTFYKHSNLREWIVYDKSTRKAKLSSNHRTVFPYMMEDVFSYPEIINSFQVKPSATLCKKIIEGKISTLRDILAYARSYTLKNKNLSIETIYRYYLQGGHYVLNLIEDPENVEDISSIMKDAPPGLVTLRPFKIKANEVGKATGKWIEWYSTQSEKYDSLFGSGDGELRCKNGIDSSF
jgi:hypothetical protein